MKKCSVEGCANNVLNCKYLKISFHTFPKADLLRQKWISACNRPKSWVPHKDSVICSEHFKKDDFYTSIPEKLQSMGFLDPDQKGKRRLMKEAVPFSSHSSLHYYTSYNTEPGFKSTRNSSQPSTSGYDYTINLPFTSNLTDNVNVTMREIEENNDSFQKKTIRKVNHPLSKKQKKNLNTEIDKDKIIVDLELQLVEMNNRYKELKSKTASLETIIKEKNQKIYFLESENKLLKESCIKKTDFEHKIKEVMSPVLSSNQMDIILNKKGKVMWTRDDIAKAFTLRYLSKNAYMFLKKENYPLPAIGTLQRYAENINMNSGILHNVIGFLKTMSENMTTQERVTVLMFDEMKVREIYEYDKKSDSILGPHNYVQIAMARGLFSNWKQPIYVNFDSRMTKKLLYEIIIALHRASFKVVATVCDYGPTNRSLFSQLEIDERKTYFHHPMTQEKIFCFLDAPYLLKLIRNWLLNAGFQLQNGTVITKNLLLKLVAMGSQNEVGSVFKFSERHLNVTDSADKQNVLLAAQLMSHTTATAIKKYFKTEESEFLSDFIQTVNDWFDIMNSRNLDGSQELKKPYQENISQIKALDKMQDYFSTMLPVGKSTQQFFQKGVLISIKSLKELYVDMTKKCNISFILTSKLNQDPLEGLFGHIRTGRGLDDHPTPLNTLYQLRMMILGKTPAASEKQANILKQDDGEEYIVATVFRIAGVTPLLDDSIDKNGIMEEELENMSSSTTSSSASSSLCIERDRVKYLSGWLARKFHKAYPELGCYTYKMMLEEHNYQKPSWVNNLEQSIGALEHLFRKINKRTFLTKKNIIKKLMNRLKNKVQLPEEVTKAFLMQRIFIRIEKLNRILKPKELKNKHKSRSILKIKKLST